LWINKYGLYVAIWKHCFTFEVYKETQTHSLIDMITLTNKAVAQKPVYLMETKEEIVAERDRLEANWSDAYSQRMKDLCRQAIVKFNTPLSVL
jgi:hypothetical protein